MNLTKEQAEQAMLQGNKVRHKYFSESEWMTIVGNHYEFEDGVKCSKEEFWYYRKEDLWENDWSIFEG